MPKDSFLSKLFNPDKYPWIWAYFFKEDVLSIDDFLKFDLAELKEGPLLNSKNREIAILRILKVRENYKNFEAQQRKKSEQESIKQSATSLEYIKNEDLDTINNTDTEDRAVAEEERIIDPIAKTSIVTDNRTIIEVERIDSKKKQNLEISISEFFSNIVPSQYFVTFSLIKELRHLSDIKPKHLDEIRESQKISTQEINRIENAVIMYSNIIALLFKEGDNILDLSILPLEYVFYTHRKANIFIKYLVDQEIDTVIGLFSFDFSTKIPSIFTHESLELKEIFINFLMKQQKYDFQLGDFINEIKCVCNLPLVGFIEDESIIANFSNRTINIVSDLFEKPLKLIELFYLLQQHKDLLCSVACVEGSDEGYICVDSLPLSYIFRDLPKEEIFVEYLAQMEKTSLSHILGFDFSIKIKGITKNEMKAFEQHYIEKIKIFDYPHIRFESYNQIPEALTSIKIVALLKTSEKLKSLKIRNIETLKDLKSHYITPYELHIILPLVKGLCNNPFEMFRKDLQKITDDHKEVLRFRAQGYSLKEVGAIKNVTRERIRQIEKKASQKLIKSVDLIGLTLLLQKKGSFTNNDLATYLNLSEIESFSVAIKYSNRMKYVSWAQAYFATETVLNFHHLNTVIDSWVGDGADLSEVIGSIREELLQYDLSCLTKDHFYDYLSSQGYHRYGDIVAKPTTVFPVLINTIIRNNFLYGIKLSDRTEDSEVGKLRGMLEEQYHYNTDDSDDRSLIARVLRIENIILWDRSTYIHIDNVEIDYCLFETIANEILKSDSSIQFSKLFKLFKSRLLHHTNIFTKDGLHGVLKYLYPEEFRYNLGWVASRKATTLSLSQQIQNFIEEKRKPISLDELVRFFGVKKYTIEQNLDRHEDVLKWDKDLFQSINHLGNLVESKVKMSEVLKQTLNTTQGYTSIYKYYSELKRLAPDILDKHGIDNTYALYSLSKYLFGNNYNFSGGVHISTHDFPIRDVSIKQIVPYLLRKNKKFFSSNNYRRVMVDLGFSNRNYEPALIAGKGIIQLSKDVFTFVEQLTIDDETLEKINTKINFLLDKNYFMALARIQDSDYKMFPDIGLEWNCFLLTSIIRHFYSKMSFKIIEPEYRNLENCSAFVVRKGEKVTTYSELVKSILDQEGREKIRENEITNFMMERGLLLSPRVSQEILSSEWVISSDI